MRSYVSISSPTCAAGVVRALDASGCRNVIDDIDDIDDIADATEGDNAATDDTWGTEEDAEETEDEFTTPATLEERGERLASGDGTLISTSGS